MLNNNGSGGAPAFYREGSPNSSQECATRQEFVAVQDALLVAVCCVLFGWIVIDVAILLS